MEGIVNLDVEHRSWHILSKLGVWAPSGGEVSLARNRRPSNRPQNAFREKEQNTQTALQSDYSHSTVTNPTRGTCFPR